MTDNEKHYRIDIWIMVVCYLVAFFCLLFIDGRLAVAFVASGISSQVMSSARERANKIEAEIMRNK